MSNRMSNEKMREHLQLRQKARGGATTEWTDFDETMLGRLFDIEKRADHAHQWSRRHERGIAANEVDVRCIYRRLAALEAAQAKPDDEPDPAPEHPPIPEFSERFREEGLCPIHIFVWVGQGPAPNKLGIGWEKFNPNDFRHACIAEHEWAKEAQLQVVLVHVVRRRVKRCCFTGRILEMNYAALIEALKNPPEPDVRLKDLLRRVARAAIDSHDSLHVDVKTHFDRSAAVVFRGPILEICGSRTLGHNVQAEKLLDKDGDSSAPEWQNECSHQQEWRDYAKRLLSLLEEGETDADQSGT